MPVIFKIRPCIYFFLTNSRYSDKLLVFRFMISSSYPNVFSASVFCLKLILSTSFCLKSPSVSVSGGLLRICNIYLSIIIRRSCISIRFSCIITFSNQPIYYIIKSVIFFKSDSVNTLFVIKR